MSSADRYVYPGTDVLINKYDCRDAEELKRIEYLTTAGNLAYLQMNPLEGAFDFEHLKKIHYIIFQDIYEWAGKVRTVDIGKQNLFCRAQFIYDYAETVFSGFYSSCDSLKNQRLLFVENLAARYADLNALHPFREGNGRSQREFTRELCMKCGYVFDLTKTTHNQMLSASIKSFNHADNSELIDIFSRCVIPLEEYKDLQSRLSKELLILSCDDL